MRRFLSLMASGDRIKAPSDLQVRKVGGELLPFRGTIGVLCIHMGRGWFKIFGKYIMQILKIPLQVGKSRFTPPENRHVDSLDNR
jgi:hypothetical protein